jgi:predicted dithiol-disulfide oxidoreductase (DUF899 family)
MIDQEAWEELRQIDEELSAKKEELAERRKELIRGPVEDYTLTGWDGPVTLSELFGERDDLLIAHNMGKSCRYCTLWADEYNGVLDHIEDRTAFAVVSPDPPEVQQAFAESRGWEFTMVSDQSEDFSRAMGYRTEDGWAPGVTGFSLKDDSTIERVSTRWFGPGDDFCGVWHFFDMLEDGPDGWAPKYRYDR